MVKLAKSIESEKSELDTLKLKIKDEHKELLVERELLQKAHLDKEVVETKISHI
jgi:hypothetical protein